MKLKYNWKKMCNYLLLCQVFMIMVLFGAVLNFLAVSNNGGKMPVYNLYVESSRHFSFYNQEDVKFFYLTDIIPLFMWKDYVLKGSVGDMFILGGILFYLSTTIAVFIFGLFGVVKKIKPKQKMPLGSPRKPQDKLKEKLT